MQLQGEQLLPLPLAQVWPRLSDLGFLVECIPDSSDAQVLSADRARCVVRPGVSFLRGSIDVDIARTMMKEPSELEFHVASKGIGSGADVTTRLRLDDADAQTRVTWSAEVAKLGGLLKMVPSALLQATAQKVIGDVWQGIAARLGT
jgi:carbon monoxide dehydrogenase subunit G